MNNKDNDAKTNSPVPVADIKGGYKQEEILRLADTEQIGTPERSRHKYKAKSLAAADKRRDELIQIMLARVSGSGWTDTPNISDPARPFVPTDPSDNDRTTTERGIWARARFAKTAQSNPGVRKTLERVEHVVALAKARCGISPDAPLQKKSHPDDLGYSLPRIHVFFDNDHYGHLRGAELYESGIDGDDGESSFVAAPPPPAGKTFSRERENEFAADLFKEIGCRIVVCWHDNNVAYMKRLLSKYADDDCETKLFPLSLATFMGLPVNNHGFFECVDLRGVDMKACKARAPKAQRASAMAELFDTFVNNSTVNAETSDSTTVSREDLLNRALGECFLINDRAECARRLWELVGEKGLPKPAVSICQELVNMRGKDLQMSSVARLWRDVYLKREPEKVCLFGHEGFLRPNHAFDCDVALKDIPLWVKRNMNKTDLAALDELRSSFPHFASLIDAVAPYSLIGLAPRPAMAYGDPGTGKSAFFAALAKVLGVPCMRIDAGTISAGFLLSGSSTSWDKSSTGEFWNILTRCGSASPLIFIDEIDKIADDRRFPVIPALLAALEPSTSGCFTDEHAGLGVDLSRVIWMAAANDLNAVPPPLLSRFTAIKINPPSGEQARAVCLSITRDRVEWFHEESGVKMDFSEQAVHTLSSMVPRDMRKEAERALAIALNRGSFVVDPQDINKPPIEEKRRIGFSA